MVKIYCELCEKEQPLIIDHMGSDKLNGEKIWGDLLCGVCKLVIATVTADTPGKYQIVRVGD